MNTAFVTGVSRGLGEAVAVSLLADGWEVFGIGRSAGPALAVPGFELVRCDLADLPAALLPIERAMAAVASSTAFPVAASAAYSLSGSPVHSTAGSAPRSPARTPSRVVLVNNAAVAEPVGLLGTLTSEAILRSLTVNLAAPAVLANAFCASFADPAQPRLVINVTSGSAAHVMAGSGLYSVAKCGMEMLTRALTADHPEPAFRAVTLRPGIIDTDMQQFMRSRSTDELPNVALFQDFHQSGRLVDAATVAMKMLARLIDCEVEAGRTYAYAEL
jgi:NAD(P)-dependent dehydrogenase (short-subunit alcohol dehydrogenase family)